MSQPASRILALPRRWWSNRRGATATIVALLLPTVVGLTGFVIDVGHLYYVQRTLQSSADAAAMAGATKINCCTSPTGTALTVATSYSSVASGKNALHSVTVTMASGYPTLKCLTTTGVSCTGPDSANAIQVKQTASVPMFFASIFGVTTMPVTATATASAAGGKAKALDIMIIVDTTGSMNSSDSSCSISGATRLTCALAGVRALLSGLSTTGDYVGLMVFPGLTSATQAQYDYSCNNTSPAIASYKNSPVYQVLGLANTYKATPTATTLSTSSNLVIAAQGGASGCTQGMKAVGGYGTFYADAVTAAQTALTTNGRTNVQKVIILLSDGDASASASNMPTGRTTNQCHQAITAATTATAAGTWVYTIAYGASTTAGSSCATDTPAISACSTLQQMASTSKMFFSDTTGGSSTCTSSANSAAELVSLFQAVGSSFGSPRLVPNNTT